MDEMKKLILERYLGTLWTELMKNSDCVGAFVLWHGSREFYVDTNTIKLLGATKSAVSYDTLESIAEDVKTQNDSSSPIRTAVIDTGDPDITVGFVSRRESTDPDRISELYLLIPQNKLAERIAKCKENSFLMLIRFEYIDNARDELAFIRSGLEAMWQICPNQMILAYHSKYQYWVFVPELKEDPAIFVPKLRLAVRDCRITDEFGVMISKSHTMTFTGGYVTFDGRNHTAVKAFHYASFALYEAVSDGVGTVRRFSRDIYDLQKNDYLKVQKFFNLLEDNNLFKYHFQPIVNADDGSIFAYEALMRTDPSIGLNPLQVIDMAQKYDRLYDIEYSTLFNVLYQLSNNQVFFIKRKLFINAIPSSFLTEEDWNKLVKIYGELMEKVVIELTEQTDTSDENLSYIMKRLRENKVQMAIDDYGTGYSNTSRLIKYTPDYIKLDHSLISGIDTNVKLQSIVSGLIEMMHANGFKVLAEGVETAEEMRCMAGMHVDLYQGFYISRPKPFFINEISEDIKSEIVRYSFEAKGSGEKIYQANNGGKLHLSELIRGRYTGIFIGADTEIIGDPESPPIIMPITVKENISCAVLLKNVRLEAEPDKPIISLNSGSKATLAVYGDNRLSKGGILVPPNAWLTLGGTGKLTILPESVSCYGIGNEYDLPYGNIDIKMTGELDITACGDNCVGIGGGRPDNGSSISISGGAVEVNCSGAKGVGVGSMQEDAKISISSCSLDVNAASANFVGIGAFTGDADVTASNLKLGFVIGGNTMCAIGSKDGGNAKIFISHCEMNTRIKGRNIINIGSSGSRTDCEISNSAVTLYCEGGTASGIGDSSGKGRVDIKDTDVSINFLTSNGFSMGCRDGELVFSGGVKMIKINE